MIKDLQGIFVDWFNEQSNPFSFFKYRPKYQRLGILKELCFQGAYTLMGLTFRNKFKSI